LIGLIGATVLATLATSQTAFWVAGILIGIFAGPNQSASRSLMARFIPHDMENEFFGFFAFSGKLTAFFGPFLLGLLTVWSGSQRVGVSVVIVLFLVGMAVLFTVDETEGSRVRAG
jgi:UMF1 family MFS transporter